MHKCCDDEGRDEEDLVSGHRQRFLRDSCSEHTEEDSVLEANGGHTYIKGVWTKAGDQEGCLIQTILKNKY